MRKQIFFVLAVTAVAYANIFFNGPAIDDKVFLGKYCPSVVEAFKGVVPKGHEGVYRPVRGVIYSVYCKIWGSNVWGYHLHSLLVHLAATGLVYLIIKHLSFPRRRESIVAALLFGLHPIHTEAITYMAASMEMTGVVFMLLAFYLYLKNKNVLSYLFAILAFFTYEMTLTLPLLLLLYEGVFSIHSVTLNSFQGRSGSMLNQVQHDKRRAGMTKKLWPYFGVLVFYLVVRMGSVGVVGRAPYLAGSPYLTAITMPKVIVKYIQLMSWPVNLANNHIIAPGIEAFVYRGYRTAAIAAQSILDPEILGMIGIIGAIGGIGWKIRKKQPLIAFGIGWFFISLLPVLEIVPQGSMLNERSLYLASVGFVMVMVEIMSVMLNLIQHRSKKDGLIPNRVRDDKISIQHDKKWSYLLLVLILLFYGGGTVIRNSQWRDEITFWSREVAIYPTESAYARFSLGDAYYREKKYPEAIEQYKKSVEINQGFAVGYASLARTYADINQVELSNLNYQLAGQVEPGFWQRQ